MQIIHKLFKEIEPYLSAFFSFKSLLVGMSGIGSYLALTNPIVDILGLPFALMFGLGLWIWDLLRKIFNKKSEII